jgi:hypothetical protein
VAEPSDPNGDDSDQGSSKRPPPAAPDKRAPPGRSPCLGGALAGSGPGTSPCRGGLSLTSGMVIPQRCACSNHTEDGGWLGDMAVQTSSLSGFSTQACSPRIAPVTWVNDVPLETVANRSAPMACGPNVDQSRHRRVSTCQPDQPGSTVTVNQRIQRVGAVGPCGGLGPSEDGGNVDTLDFD